MDWSTPDLSVPHHLPEFVQVHVHCIDDAIQTSHPLTPSFPPAFILSSAMWIDNSLCPKRVKTHIYKGQGRWRSSIQSVKIRPGPDCGSDHELLIAKFRLKLKKVGKTTRPFRYDQNQITYDYTVEVRNRFKGLDLRNRAPDELWMEVCDIVQETGIKTIPKKKKCKKAKWLSKEALQIAVKTR